MIDELLNFIGKPWVLFLVTVVAVMNSAIAYVFTKQKIKKLENDISILDSKRGTRVGRDIEDPQGSKISIEEEELNREDQ